MYLFMRPCLLGCKTDKCRISAHPSHGSLVTQCGIACEEHIGRRRLRRCIQADPSEFGPQGEEGVYQPGEMGDGLGRKPSFHKSQEKSAEWGGWGGLIGHSTVCESRTGVPPPAGACCPHSCRPALGTTSSKPLQVASPDTGEPASFPCLVFSSHSSDPDMWCPLGFCSVSGRRIHLFIRVLQHPDMRPGYRLPGTQQELSEGKVYFRYNPQVPLPTQRRSPGMFL